MDHYWAVRKTHQEYGMAVGDEEAAEDLKEKLESADGDEYEVVERRDPDKQTWMLEKVAGLFS